MCDVGEPVDEDDFASLESACNLNEPADLEELGDASVTNTRKRRSGGSKSGWSKYSEACHDRCNELRRRWDSKTLADRKS